MKGAAPVEPKKISKPINPIVSKMGNNHHFLFSAMNTQNSCTRDGAGLSLNSWNSLLVFASFRSGFCLYEDMSLLSLLFRQLSGIGNCNSHFYPKKSSSVTLSLMGDLFIHKRNFFSNFDNKLHRFSQTVTMGNSVSQK